MGKIKTHKVYTNLKCEHMRTPLAFASGDLLKWNGTTFEKFGSHATRGGMLRRTGTPQKFNWHGDSSENDDVADDDDDDDNAEFHEVQGQLGDNELHEGRST